VVMGRDSVGWSWLIVVLLGWLGVVEVLECGEVGSGGRLEYILARWRIFC
jgi:hypothetical protein